MLLSQDKEVNKKGSLSLAYRALHLFLIKQGDCLECDCIVLVYIISLSHRALTWTEQPSIVFYYETMYVPFG